MKPVSRCTSWCTAESRLLYHFWAETSESAICYPERERRGCSPGNQEIWRFERCPSNSINFSQFSSSVKLIPKLRRQMVFLHPSDQRRNCGERLPVSLTLTSRHHPSTSLRNDSTVAPRMAPESDSGFPMWTTFLVLTHDHSCIPFTSHSTHGVENNSLMFSPTSYIHSLIRTLSTLGIHILTPRLSQLYTTSSLPS